MGASTTLSELKQFADEWVFEPHGCYSSDYLGEDWPLGYISKASPRVPIFALGPVLEYPTEDLMRWGSLIAAAPDLFRSLRNMVRLYEELQGFQTPTSEEAKAILARACASHPLPGE